MRGLAAIFLVSAVVLGARSEERPGDVSAALNTLLQDSQARARGLDARLDKTPSRKDELILPDEGEIAIIDDGDGVAFPAFLFDLEGQSVDFLPTGSGYRYGLRERGYDAQAAADGEFLVLGDDDAAELELPFAFPFYGEGQARIFVNSDGNLTFGQADTSSTARDAARAVTTARIAGFFADLDPTRPGAAVRVCSNAEKWVVTWINVPEWVAQGTGRLHTFQISLYPDGRIVLSYRAVNTDFAIIGLSSGENLNESFAVDFSEPDEAVFEAAVVEIFAAPDINLALLGQKFYLSHEDAYDFLVVFHDHEIALDTNAFAFYRAIRNFTQGIGPLPTGFEDLNVVDFGELLGSAFRLQGVMYMGDLAKYPDEPHQRLGREQGLTLNTPLTVLAHEAGHRFLANVFYVDPATGALSLDLLGRQLAHWSFFYNSEASLLEGNRIADRGVGPFRFETVKTVEGFSPLDRYLMGLIPASDVPDSFHVRNPDIEGEAFTAARNPLAGVLFDGERVDVPTSAIVEAMGRRSPDHTISQKSFRYGFVMLVEEGTEARAEDLAKLDRFRTEFESYMEAKTGGFEIETELVRQLTFLTWPAAGVLEGQALDASLFLGEPADHPLRIEIDAPGSFVGAPEEVEIPAGEQIVPIMIQGRAEGVERLNARVLDPVGQAYEQAETHVQVLAGAGPLAAERVLPLEILFGDPRERLKTGAAGQVLPYSIFVQVSDENGLSYEGVTVRFEASGDGAATPEAVTDEFGFAVTDWRLASAPGPNTLTVRIDGSAREPLVVEAVGTRDPVRGRNSRREIFR